MWTVSSSDHSNNVKLLKTQNPSSCAFLKRRPGVFNPNNQNSIKPTRFGFLKNPGFFCNPGFNLQVHLLSLNLWHNCHSASRHGEIPRHSQTTQHSSPVTQLPTSFMLTAGSRSKTLHKRNATKICTI